MVVVVGTAQLSGRAADDEAVDDARATTELLAHVGRRAGASRAGSSPATPGAIDRFDRTVLDRLLVGDVDRIKIWTADGRSSTPTRPG